MRLAIEATLKKRKKKVLLWGQSSTVISKLEPVELDVPQHRIALNFCLQFETIKVKCAKNCW